MLRQEIEIINKLGMHARASTKLTQTSSRYKCEIWIERNNRRVNAKSIMGVMMLAAGLGASVELECDGPKEQEATQALQNLINDKFGEGE